MTSRIHPTALVDRTAELAADVEVGPWALVGPQCVVGAGSVLAARSVLESHVRLGRNVRVGIGTVLGGLPQDLKFKGEETWVEIGDGTTIREYSTINRGTAESFKTSVGKNCFLMSYVHLAHDCHVGDNVIISNATQLAGHVTVEDYAGISGVCAVHQFTRIGRHSYIGGHSRVPKDVPPFVKAVGNPIQLYGLNSVGLQRRGFSAETLAELKKAYRLFFRSELNLSQALERARGELKQTPEVAAMIAFFEASERGATL
ncbi:MAG: acyl-ACP--UDP-N-acetylglucosamine O-acyltransferase [Gemmatimonadota bacterium]|nr:acyl-ACP--UDP-N-acetylglucosamine O-acyltransferase [Gemmatimonadota bacterium]